MPHLNLLGRSQAIPISQEVLCVLVAKVLPEFPVVGCNVRVGLRSHCYSASPRMFICGILRSGCVHQWLTTSMSGKPNGMPINVRHNASPSSSKGLASTIRARVSAKAPANVSCQRVGFTCYLRLGYLLRFGYPSSAGSTCFRACGLSSPNLGTRHHTSGNTTTGQPLLPT